MNTKYQTKKEIIYADLSGKIIGILFQVYNELGYGHLEKVYQKAIAIALAKAGMKFVEQLYAPVVFEGKVVGKNYFDFLIEGVIVLEIKKGDYFVKADIDQVYRYLVTKNLKLGILAYFAPRTLHFKRVVNLRNPYIRKNS
ncbi:MAG: GxxExxY protein [Patescibacteria group bacterium]|nr:GxxExxY protein [Patescibacteria group bacterium]